jgi:hypothetical protein
MNHTSKLLQLLTDELDHYDMINQFLADMVILFQAALIIILPRIVVGCKEQ